MMSHDMPSIPDELVTCEPLTKGLHFQDPAAADIAAC